MIYSIKLNGMLHCLFFIFYKLLCVMIFILIQVLVLLDFLRVDYWDSAQVEVIRVQ